MGDSKTVVSAKDSLSEISNSCEVTTPSINLLKAAKSSENISISKSVIKDPLSNPAEANESSKKEDLENIIKDTKSEDNKMATKPEIDTNKIDIPKLKQARKIKNKSHIFSLSENKNLPSTIFSIGGAPSRTIHKDVHPEKSKESTSTISTQGSTVSKQSQIRNPLTGIGVSSNDEFKTKPSKRKGMRFLFETSK